MPVIGVVWWLEDVQRAGAQGGRAEGGQCRDRVGACLVLCPGPEVFGVGGSGLQVLDPRLKG
jgi:hypothetical protein